MDKDVLHQGLFFALQQPRHIANPYPLYSWLRANSPFHWDFVSCAWFVTRYADVRTALADPRLTTENFPFNVSQLPLDIQKDLAPLGRVMRSSVLYNDAPAHDRLRRPLNRAFNPNAFERLRPEMKALAGELLAKAERRGSVDFVSDYCEPLADYMLGELLGSARAGRPELIELCAALRKFLTARRMGRETFLGAKVAITALEGLRKYVRSIIIASRQEHVADNVIARSLAVEPNEAPPTEDEILSNCVLSVDAGVRNMSASITNAVIALLRHPEEFARLRDDPESMSIATEELLRYDSPVQVAVRSVPEEIEFARRRIGPNQELVLLLGAANRDPKQFADPDRLDLTRRPNHHVSFGVGPHGCVGGWMTRFGLAIAIGAIIQRQTELRLTPTKLQWYFPLIRRTVRALPVLIDRRLRDSQRSRLRVARALSPRPTRVAQTPIPSSQ
jgi:pimeloyl-[acyl-carrier protein] synthase